MDTCVRCAMQVQERFHEETCKCSQGDVRWQVPQHLSVSGDSTEQVRGWTQAASGVDAEVSAAGLEAGRQASPHGAATGSVQGRAARLAIAAMGRRRGAAAESAGASGSGA